jgi:two-component system response regulator (stage 0 sporulation protein F)
LPVQELEKRGIYQLRKPMDIGGVLRMITHALASFEERLVYEQYQ